MAGVEQLDLDQAFERMIRLAEKCGADTGTWELCVGDADVEPRVPWSICDERRVLTTLGYTRRAALSALLSQCGILATILGA
jgi:hypothetical protein